MKYDRLDSSLKFQMDFTLSLKRRMFWKQNEKRMKIFGLMRKYRKNTRTILRKTKEFRVIALLFNALSPESSREKWNARHFSCLKWNNLIYIQIHSDAQFGCVCWFLAAVCIIIGVEYNILHLTYNIEEEPCSRIQQRHADGAIIWILIELPPITSILTKFSFQIFPF